MMCITDNFHIGFILGMLFVIGLITLYHALCDTADWLRVFERRVK